MEQAGVPRSVVMKLTGHRTENVYRRYAIVSEGRPCGGRRPDRVLGHVPPSPLQMV